MKSLISLYLLLFLNLILGCSENKKTGKPQSNVTNKINFQYVTTINIGGKGASEISAYDSKTKKLFTANLESNEVTISNLSKLDAIVRNTPINLNAFGSPNSVSVSNGKLAVAVEAPIKQDLGKVLVFDTVDHLLLNQYSVGALPDMVAFTSDGNLIVSANEGEPNDDYSVDPKGSVSIIDLSDDSVTTLDFTAFNAQLDSLKRQGLRVFGPNASLAQDIEPEFVAISDDNETAWITLQENNALATVNLVTKTIERISPLGYKNYNLEENEIDASDMDGGTVLRSWPVFGMYQPDGITYVKIKGAEYVVTANEGDSRVYNGFSEEIMVKNINLDKTVFPLIHDFQHPSKLGRLIITNTMGDIDNDGDYDRLYSYGARSFSIWSTDGNLVYDSGNLISKILLTLKPDRFDDHRSIYKASEPESVEVLNMANERYILFVGLERANQILMFDITNPKTPEFLSKLSHAGDIAPEGLLLIPKAESPNGKDLLIVSHEVSGTVSIYQNE